jgi:hypothetical protein
MMLERTPGACNLVALLAGICVALTAGGSDAQGAAPLVDAASYIPKGAELCMLKGEPQVFLGRIRGGDTEEIVVFYTMEDKDCQGCAGVVGFAAIGQEDGVYTLLGRGKSSAPGGLLAPKGGVLRDINQDGRDEIVFRIVVGASITTQEIFLWNPDKKTVCRAAGSALARLGYASLRDVDGDGKDEIVVRYHRRRKFFPDFYEWDEDRRRYCLRNEHFADEYEEQHIKSLRRFIANPQMNISVVGSAVRALVDILSFQGREGEALAIAETFLEQAKEIQKTDEEWRSAIRCIGKVSRSLGDHYMRRRDYAKAKQRYVEAAKMDDRVRGLSELIGEMPDSDKKSQKRIEFYDRLSARVSEYVSAFANETGEDVDLYSLPADGSVVPYVSK